MEARQIQTTEPVLQIIRRAYRHYQPNATVSLCTGRIDRPMSESGGAADFSAQSSTDASVSNFLHGQKMYHIRRASDVLHWGGECGCHAITYQGNANHLPSTSASLREGSAARSTSMTPSFKRWSSCCLACASNRAASASPTTRSASWIQYVRVSIGEQGGKMRLQHFILMLVRIFWSIDV